MIPLGLLLVARGRWRALIAMGGSAAVTITFVLVPFALADRSDTIYSLVTHRAQLPVGGGSFWQLVVGTPYQWLPQRWDVLFVLGLVVLLSLIVIAGRRDLEPSSPDVYALLALTALALPLLAKSVWPYYYLDAYVFGAVWLLGQAEPLALRRQVLALDKALAGRPPSGLISTVPAYASLLCHYDPGVTDAARLEASILELEGHVDAAMAVGSVVDVPTQYDGPDLASVALQT